MSFTPTLGTVLAILVIVLGLLLAVGVLPANAQSVGGLLVALGIARLT